MKPTERRRSVRAAPSSDAARRVRFVGGADGQLHDASEHGACVESLLRTAPGRRLILTWPGLPGMPRMAARVVRVTVARLTGEAGVAYRIGVELDVPSRAMWELTTLAG